MKTTRLISAIFLLLSVSMSSPLSALDLSVDRVSIAVGSGDNTDTIGTRIAAQWDWPGHWLTDYYYGVTGYWDLSYAFIYDYDSDEESNSPHVFAFSPVLRIIKNIPYESTIRPFYEIGFGVSLFTKTRADNRRLSTAFQFEDRIGVGIQFGENADYELKYNWFHYSNAGIKLPNGGVNNHAVTFSWLL